MMGLINPLILSSEIGHFLGEVIVVYLGHGMFSPVAVLILLQISFWERSYAPNLRNLRKKVAHLCRSTRLIGIT